LANAIKHSLEGTITVWAKPAPEGSLNFGVTDTGIGIPEDELCGLTQRFSQVHESQARKFEGTGLGLSLVNALMARHDGSVHITSEVGVGTTVSCHLPRQRVLPLFHGLRDAAIN
jgi:cell cycle sensor histidine kinase DivJ